MTELRFRYVALVDDEPLICELIAEALDHEMHVVHYEHDFDAGAKLLDSRSFDLALIDIRMPGGSGFALAAAAANKHTPSIVLTGDGDAVVKCTEFGFHYIAKPFSIVALSREAARAMSDKEAALTQIREALARMAEATQLLQDEVTASRQQQDESRDVGAKAEQQHRKLAS